MIFKTTFFYYILAVIIAFSCINSQTLYFLRLGYLTGFLNSSWPQNKIIIYDYLAHVQPKDDVIWSKLAENYAIWGEYPQAISAYRKAIAINPQESSYPKALSLVYKLKKAPAKRRGL